MSNSKNNVVILLCIFFSVEFIYASTDKLPIIVITDCYHPYQDPGDNLDLISGFALDNVDLKAIILDITDSFRKDTADHLTLWKDPRGPREAGIIPIMQLNYIFNKNVPFAIGPMHLMKSESDKMDELTGFEENGIKLLLKILRDSKKKIQILSFGSARILAVAYNREPELLKRKIKIIHLSAGTASQNYQLGSDIGANSIPGGEWNVALDLFAFKKLLSSNLPIAIYPCAGKDGGFVKDVNNTYWTIKDMSFLKNINPKLQRYLDFAFNKKNNVDFLKCMNEGPLFSNRAKITIEPFHVWETAIWLKATDRELVKKANGEYVILKKTEIKSNDIVLKNNLIQCKIELRHDGRFKFLYTKEPTNFSIYFRDDVDLNERALQSAFPKLLKSYQITNK